MQLGLNAKRETYKTQIKRAKEARGSGFSGFGGGGGGRRTSHRAQNDSWMFGSSSGGGFFDGSSPSLDFITGGSSKPSRGRKQRSGLEDLFT